MPTNNMFKTNINRIRVCVCMVEFQLYKEIYRFKKIENKIQTPLKAGYVRPDFPQTDPGTEQRLTCK